MPDKDVKKMGHEELLDEYAETIWSLAKLDTLGERHEPLEDRSQELRREILRRLHLVEDK